MKIYSNNKQCKKNNFINKLKATLMDQTIEGEKIIKETIKRNFRKTKYINHKLNYGFLFLWVMSC